jgi:hypothetical protein
MSEAEQRPGLTSMRRLACGPNEDVVGASAPTNVRADGRSRDPRQCRGGAEIAILFSDTALDDEIEGTFEPIRFELTIAQSSCWYDG